MCLYIYQKESLIAEEDIVCYKMLMVKKTYQSNNLTNYRYFSPFYDWEWIIGQVHENIEKVTHNTYRICGGYFHTFVDSSDAYRLTYHQSFKYYDVAIAKCIIPKGTKYFTGDDGKENSGYASKALKVIEILSINSVETPYD